MTALSEAQLIEIAARFASLDRQIERADLVLVERLELYTRRAESAEAAWKRNTDPERAEGLRSAMAVLKLDAAEISNIRYGIESKLEACQQDLLALIEQVRRAQ